MKGGTFVWVWDRKKEKGKLVPKHLYRRKQAAKSFQIMGDIEPFVSPIDKSIVGSRSTYRAHMRQHGVIDVGNERIPSAPRTIPPGLGEHIKRAWESQN